MIPTKDNLFRRWVALQGTSICVGGCSKEESINHLFLRCNFLVVFDISFIGDCIFQRLTWQMFWSIHKNLGPYAFRKEIQFDLQVIWLASI